MIACSGSDKSPAAFCLAIPPTTKPNQPTAANPFGSIDNFSGVQFVPIPGGDYGITLWSTTTNITDFGFGINGDNTPLESAATNSCFEACGSNPGKMLAVYGKSFFTGVCGCGDGSKPNWSVAGLQVPPATPTPFVKSGGAKNTVTYSVAKLVALGVFCFALMRLYIRV
ncbi:hypothetical protein HDU76_013783 [Blyttiomyces sp. JEL0837]|nr:hypothetical protein HDU76_013783 [Blyttiomyces sp. JEL0837]